MRRTKILILVLIVSLLSNPIFASCDWSKIQKNADGTYTYSAELNRCVGKLVQDSKDQQKEVSDLLKAVSLKDLSLQEADKRAKMWNDTASNLEDRLQKVDKIERGNNWLYFGLGVLTTFVAGAVASHAYR